MIFYLLRRLCLLPITLLAILFVNFVIINLAPTDPSMYMDSGSLSEGRSSENLTSGFSLDSHRIFRMRYGLNLPLVFNTWLFTSKQEVLDNLLEVHHLLKRGHHATPIEQTSLRKLYQHLGDSAHFQMTQLLAIASDSSKPLAIRLMCSDLMVKGALRLGIGRLSLTAQQRSLNEQIAHENRAISTWILTGGEEDDNVLKSWHNLLHQRPDLRRYSSMDRLNKIVNGFIETRFVQYLYRVLSLDFGTLRTDPNLLVTQEVLARVPISLFLSIIPLIFSFLISLPLGLLMAIFHRSSFDRLLNIILLCFYAAPVFVIAPMLLEFFAGHGYFPSSGFHSPKRAYDLMTSSEKLYDILNHVFLPMIAIAYSMASAKARLARSSILEILHQDYILSARARGLSLPCILFKHVLKNASITLVTAMAGSLGIVLGGSLIVETLFDINGFGKFFYEAILMRDINVVMFSTLIGSMLTLSSYLLADLCYTLLDPRVQLE